MFQPMQGFAGVTVVPAHSETSILGHYKERWRLP